MTIGLRIPGRPPTPSDGRAQHYLRPGEVGKQKTRSFQNGTTLTFGPEDPIDDFRRGDPFFEQVLVIEAAEADINSVLERYRGVEAATLGLHKDELSILDASISDRFPKVRRASSTDSIPATQLGFDDHIEHCKTFVASKTHLTLPAFSTANVYQSMNRSTSPGLSHPGFSTDTRGGRIDISGGLPRQTAVRYQNRKAQTTEAGLCHTEGGCAPYRPQETHVAQILEPVTSIMRPSSKNKGRSRSRRPHLNKKNACHQHQTVLNPMYPTRPVPMHLNPSGTLQRHISVTEYYRWMLIKEQLIVVPRTAGEPGPPLAYLVDPVEPLNHPNIRELQGPRENWTFLFKMNINQGKTGQRSKALENILDDIIFGKEVSNCPVELPNNANLPFDGGLKKQHKGRNRSDSDASSVWHKEISDENISTIGSVEHSTYTTPTGPSYQAIPQVDMGDTLGYATLGGFHPRSIARVPPSQNLGRNLGHPIPGEPLQATNLIPNPSPNERRRNQFATLRTLLPGSRQSSPGTISTIDSHFFLSPTRSYPVEMGHKE